MTSAMFGGNHFRVRKRLADVVMRVLELADKTAADKSPLLDKGIAAELTQPFMLLVCGEVNAGKSSLINALIGADLCETNTLPETRKVHWYCYGERHHDDDVSPVLSRCSRPQDILVDVNPVDTPGSDSGVQYLGILAEEFFPRADLVLWVFPAKDPWTASTWDSISKQDPAIIEKSVFVLQQADLCTGKDISVIMGHVRDLSVQRLGRVLPVFPVSANRAGQIAAANRGSDVGWQESGAKALEDHVSEMVAGCQARKELLRRAGSATLEVLHHIEERIGRQTSQLNNDELFLREIEDEIDHERAEHTASQTAIVASMRQLFAGQVDQVLGLLKRRTGVMGSIRSLFMADSLPHLMVLSLAESVEHAVEHQAQEQVEGLAANCRDHWESLRPRVKEQLGLSLGDFDQQTEGFEAAKTRFASDMGRAAKGAVVDLKIRAALESKLAGRRSGLKVWIYLLLVLLGLAGFCGAEKIGPYPYPALGLLAGAGMALLAFIVAVHRSRRSLFGLVAASLEDCKYRFADALGRDYRHGVGEFYNDYAALLEHVRCHIGTSQLKYRPNHEEWNRLFFEFKDIEYEL